MIQLPHDHELSPEQIADANDWTRRVIGKPIERCNSDELERVQQAIHEEKQFLEILRGQQVHEVEQVIDRARLRREQRERREGA